MSNGALSIPITADASKFLKTLADVKDEIKGLKKELDTATGTRVAAINLEITGLEQQKTAFKEFGKFAEGTYGRLLQQLDYLNAYALTLKVDSTELKNTFAEIEEVKKSIKVIEGKEVKVKVEVEPPPLGSIADLRQTIKTITSKRDLETDRAAFEQYNRMIQLLEDRIKELKGIGIDLKPADANTEIAENSILDLKRQIEVLNTKKINIDINNEEAIAALNSEITELQQKIIKTNSLSFDKNGKVTANATKATQALTSLSLVAQDLPFGFIGIQNNLPAVFSTFSQLTNTANGVKGAFGQLGKALLSPTGAFFAFSAITAAVTIAVKEYGSLDLAIKALLGTTNEYDFVLQRATEALKEYNKEIITNNEIVAGSSAKAAGEVTRVNILSAAVRDVTLSETQRANALKELQKLDPKSLENLDLQKNGYKDLDVWVQKYTDSLIANAVAQEYLSKIVSTTTQINQQSNALQEISKGFEDVANRITKAKKQIDEQQLDADLAIGILAPLYGEQKKLTQEFFDQSKVVSTLNTELDKYKKSATEATKEALNFFKETKPPTDPKGRKLDFKFELKLSDDYKQLIEYNSLDKSLDRLRQYADVVLDVNKTEKERSAALEKLKTDSKDVLGVNNQLFDSFKLGITPLAQISDGIDQYGYKLQELIVEQKKALKAAPDANNYFQSVYKSIARGLTGAEIPSLVDTSGLEAQFNLIKDLARDLPKGILDSFEEFKGVFPTLDQFKEKVNEIIQLEFLKTGSIDLTKIQEIIDTELANLQASVETEIALNVDFDQLAKGTALIEKQVQKIKDNIISAFSGIQNILQDTFFEALDQGAVNWKEFSNAVIKEVKRIAAALLAKAFVTALANLLAPGTGSAVSALLKGVDTQSLGQIVTDGDALGSANFGGIRGADMAMSGSVVMSIRGTDLVGVMNRTNVSINRVG